MHRPFPLICLSKGFFECQCTWNRHGGASDRKAFVCWGIFPLLHNTLKTFAAIVFFPLWCCGLCLKKLKASFDLVFTHYMPSCLKCCFLSPVLATGRNRLPDKETSVIPRHILFNLVTITHYRVEWYQDMRLVPCPSVALLYCLDTERTGREAVGVSSLVFIWFRILLLSSSSQGGKKAVSSMTA